MDHVQSTQTSQYPRLRQLIAATLAGVALLVTSACATKDTAVYVPDEDPKMNLNGEWKFKFDPGDIGLEKGWQNKGYGDYDWGNIEVPGDWGDEDGIGWYRKLVILPPELVNSNEAKLIFHQSDDSTQVYLNGQLAVEHHSWNTPFWVDLKDFPAPDGLLQIAVRVNDVGGNGGLLQGVEIKTVSNLRDLFISDRYAQTPNTTLEQNGSIVLYSMYVRNFTPEGTFDAATERLPELKDLGINMIWCLPIHEIGVEKRKGPDGSPYAIRDYRSLDPNLGTKEDFREFVDAAHALGIRVIIDSVMNHMSPDSVWAKEHPEWFLRDENGVPRPDNDGWEDIVDFDWDNKDLWEPATQALEYWVREFDIDGYRCDVADLAPGEWWGQTRERLMAIKPVFMLAESQTPDRHLDGFDMTYNEGLRDKIEQVLKGEAPATAISDEMMSRVYSFPEGATQMMFVENHDKPRAINFFGGPEKTKVAAVLTATLPGVPLLYTGTEVGATPDRDETFFTKTPVDFSTDPHGMREFWTSLLATRAAHPALQSGDFDIVPVEPSDKLFAFTRTKGSDTVLVVVNLSNETLIAHLSHPLASESEITLAPYDWTILAE